VSDATPQPFGPGNLPLGVERKDATVNVASLVPELTTALAKLGRLHLDMFDEPIIITSGNDGQHAPGSKHYTNRAVDIRTKDMQLQAQIMFLMVVAYMSPKLNLMLFDERQKLGSDHFHIETAD
jgi:hypothetical protein